jgi:hypothetical protein
MKQRPPNFIVHYSRGEPFRSITSTAPHQLHDALNSLDEQSSWGLNRFADPTYLEQRFEVERLMRARFVAMGWSSGTFGANLFLFGAQ